MSECKETCGSCEFFTSIGCQCVRHSPVYDATLGMGGRFPSVHPDITWCGDYKRKSK